MTYEEEKKYLYQKALDFLADKDYANADGENNHLMLKYFSEELDTEVESIELFDAFDENDNMFVEVWVRSHNDEYPDYTDLSKFDEFSNEEMKKILDLFGVEY